MGPIKLHLASRVPEQAQKRGVEVHEVDVSHSEQLDSTSQETNQAVRPVLSREWSRFRFNIAGATRVMGGEQRLKDEFHRGAQVGRACWSA